MAQLPVAPIDVQGLFQTIVGLRQAGQQQEMGQLQLASAYRNEQRQREIDKALRAGDMGRYAQLDPAGFAKMQQAGLEITKTQGEIANTRSQMADRERGAAKDLSANTLSWQERAARALEQNPQAAPMLQKRIDALAANGEIEHFQLPGFAQSPELAGPQMAPTQGEIKTMQVAAGAKDNRPADVQEFEYGRDHPDYAAYKLALKKAGGVNISNSVSSGGNSPLTPAQLSEKQGGLADVQNTIQSLGDLQKQIGGDPSRFLSWSAKGENFLTKNLDKVDTSLLSADQKQQLGETAVFQSNVKRFFNAYRKLITGAGASPTELKDLEKSTLNTNLGPTEFMALLEDTKQRAERDQAIISNIIKRGVAYGSDDFREEFNRIRDMGGDYKTALVGADTSIEQPTVGAGKNGKGGRPAAPMLSGDAMRQQAIKAADEDIAAGRAPKEARGAMITEYMRQHGGGNGE